MTDFMKEQQRLYEKRRKEAAERELIIYDWSASVDLCEREQVEEKRQEHEDLRISFDEKKDFDFDWDRFYEWHEELMQNLKEVLASVEIDKPVFLVETIQRWNGVGYNVLDCIPAGSFYDLYRKAVHRMSSYDLQRIYFDKKDGSFRMAFSDHDGGSECTFFASTLPEKYACNFEAIFQRIYDKMGWQKGMRYVEDRYIDKKETLYSIYLEQMGDSTGKEAELCGEW